MLNSIADRFRLFAERYFDTSELYQFLLWRIADDNELLELGTYCVPGQPEPNMLLGAVHRRLFDTPEAPLAQYFPDLNSSPKPLQESFPAFREFTLDNKDSIIEILSTRLVQTNEVQRSAVLFPAFMTMHRRFKERPMHCIEIGASAGLNLNWNRYQYVYNDGIAYGSKNSELTLNGRFKTGVYPDLSGEVPEICHRIGVDVNPIDLGHTEDVKWLQALIWPEHAERRARFDRATQIFKRHPVDILKQDAVEVLPRLLEQVDPPGVPYVYHTFVANQLSELQRRRLFDAIDSYGQTADIVHIHNNIESYFMATVYQDGHRYDFPLAKTDGHVNWIEWL